MTYIHLAAGLAAEAHEARDLNAWAKKRTSGPVARSPAGVLLRDCAEPVVVFGLEQLAEGCWHCRLFERNGAACGVSVRVRSVADCSRSRNEIRWKVPFTRFNQQHAKTGFLGETSGEDTARGSCERSSSAEGPR